MVENICYGKHLSQKAVQNQHNFTMLSITKNFPLKALCKSFHNAFHVLGKVRAALRRAGESREFIEAFTKEATSGDYNHLLATVTEVVEVE